MDIAVNAWFWDQPATGSGQYVRHLLPALAALEPAFRFLAVTPRATPVRPAAANVSPVVTRGFGSKSSNLFKLWFEQVAFPRTSQAHHADVMHVPYFAAPAMAKVPTVVTVHDLIPLLLPGYRGSVLVRAYMQLVSTSARRAHAIVADSEHSKHDIVTHLRVKPQHVHVIPLAVADRFRPAAAPAIDFVRARYGLPKRYILYMGGFDQRKNLPTLLKAYAQFCRDGAVHVTARLVIAGRLPTHDTSFTPDPRRVAAHLGITDAVVFPGWIDEQDQPALYSGAEVAVFPSTYEGFGLPVLEAMACGVPVVTSDRSSLPEVAGEAGITVNPDNPTALAEALVSLLEDPVHREQRRRACLDQAARFTWDRTARATLAVYRQVVER